MSIRTKMMVYLLVIGLLPLLSFYLVSNYTQKNIVNTSLNSEVKKIESILTNEFSSQLNAIKNIGELTSKSEIVKNALIQNNRDKLKDYLNGAYKALSANGDYRF